MIWLYGLGLCALATLAWIRIGQWDRRNAEIEARLEAQQRAREEENDRIWN